MIVTPKSKYVARSCYLTREIFIVVEGMVVSDNLEEMVHYEHLGEDYYRFLLIVPQREYMNLLRANNELKTIQQVMGSFVA